MRDAEERLAARLLTAEAVRERCGMLLAAAERAETLHFALRSDRLEPCAEYVLDTIRAAYPTLAIPYHSRWRHFGVGARDRWAELAARPDTADRRERLRLRFDLAMTSVLLDAGAGAAWKYRESAGGEYSRSEGLAVASFDLFASGALSSQAAAPLRVDAPALMALDEARLASAFQVSATNPIEGLGGRVRLLQQLGEAIAAQPQFFGPDGRLGGLADYIVDGSTDARIPASTLLHTVLVALGPIWPGRIRLGRVNLGDVWRHPLARTGDATDGLVPLHKLSQWLTYSLVEPLEEAGFAVTGLDALTGLAEYRNGGLLLDLGVLVPRDAGLLRRPLAPDAEAVVEWRALTVALLDRIAERVRLALGMSAHELPLAKVLEGGTWAAGRRAARERRPSGTPPLAIVSDGTVF